MRYFITLLFASACTSGPSVESSSVTNEDANPAIIVVFKSDSSASYILSRDRTFEERLQKKVNVDTLTAQRDTIHFHLDEGVQLVYGRVPLSFNRQTLLVRTGDTVHIDLKEGMADIYKLKRNKKKNALWSEWDILPTNSLFKEKEALRSVFLTEQPAGEMIFLMPNMERKDDWSAHLEDYIKVIDEYYGRLLDSLSRIDGKEEVLYRDILRRAQYLELSSLHDVVNDSVLSSRLNSSEYISLDNFKNRYSNNIIYKFFHKNFMFNNDVTLTEAYDEGFTQYPDEMRRFFKTQALQSMIVKKHDRDVVLTYVKRYEKEYGTVTPLETILKEIEYGAVTDHDLILQDQLGKEVKWEALRQQWQGKFIYVDFWASWCAPCLRAIPFSKELQKQLLNREVVFVYLALNDEEEAWRNMSKKHQIEENNYLILNPKSSEFISQTNLDAIPRYMIYDRNGQLIHPDAPGPEQKEALEVLTSYLKNDRRK